MSFENLVRILPIGLASKNTAGAFSSFQTACWCIFFDESKLDEYIETPLRNTNNQCQNTKSQKIPKYSGSFWSSLFLSAQIPTTKLIVILKKIAKPPKKMIRNIPKKLHP